MIKVFICAPLGGDVLLNIEKAKRYAHYAFRSGAAPVVPHFYAEILDDSKPNERELGRMAALSLLWSCDEVWVFSDTITEGMEKEIRTANAIRIPVKYITEVVVLEKKEVCL